MPERAQPLPSARERLAASRQALLAELSPPAPAPRPRSERRAAADRADRADRAGWWAQVPWTGVARRVAQRWWRRHPANAVGQLAQPLLARYAREEPAKLIATSAATGALLVLVRPWRLLSATALLAALLKTSDVADVVTTLLQKNHPPRKEEP